MAEVARESVGWIGYKGDQELKEAYMGETEGRSGLPGLKRVRQTASPNWQKRAKKWFYGFSVRQRQRVSGKLGTPAILRRILVMSPSHLSASDEGYQALPTATDQPESVTDTMGNEEQLIKPEGRRGDGIALYAAMTAAATFTTMTWLIVLSNNPTALGWFAFHPTLQSLAIFSFTLGETILYNPRQAPELTWRFGDPSPGILTLQPTSQPATKAAGLQRHQIAMIFGLPTIVLGALSIIWNKSVHDAPHFTTWHGVFGLLSLTWLVVQFSFGAASVWFDGAALGGGLKAKRLWKYHRLSGYILLPLVFVTANFGGAWSTWTTSSSAHGVRLIAYTIAPLVILTSLYIRLRPSKMKFF
ncbi:hypothetical protein EW146_g6631 [Bondarzewia mesenterica]|uniref:Cytochrome b561 domain-containing protein n=1 Tax=Bondarzewia mesenterica TaxID=1095465 RepID=A0A4S4LNN3_9AGAM|nr:hypothetical protein EW146_g6631 [Bondarzewia mesenterica]